MKVETFLSLHHSASTHVRDSEFDSIRARSEEGKHFLTEGLNSCLLFLGIWCFNGKSTGVVCRVFLREYDSGTSSTSCLLRNSSHHSEWCWGFMALGHKKLNSSFILVSLRCILSYELWTPAWQPFVYETVIKIALLLKPVAYHWVSIHALPSWSEEMDLGDFFLALGIWRGVSWPPCSQHGSNQACCFLVLTWMFGDTGIGMRGMRTFCAPSTVITGSYRGLHKFR